MSENGLKLADQDAGLNEFLKSQGFEIDGIFKANFGTAFCDDFVAFLPDKRCLTLQIDHAYGGSVEGLGTWSQKGREFFGSITIGLITPDFSQPWFRTSFRRDRSGLYTEYTSHEAKRVNEEKIEVTFNKSGKPKIFDFERLFFSAAFGGEIWGLSRLLHINNRSENSASAREALGFSGLELYDRPLAEYSAVKDRQNGVVEKG